MSKDLAEPEQKGSRGSMKERSNNAASCPREKENAVVAELAKLLPLPSSCTTQLDKASVIRFTTSYLKMRKLFPRGLGNEWGSVTPNTFSSDGFTMEELSIHHLQSLDGFVFVLAADAKIIYISETASVHLGLSQIEMIGNSIYDFIHTSECDEMKKLLNPEEPIFLEKFTNEDIEIPRSFCLRMKCFLPKKDAGLTFDGYKAIHCSGYLKLRHFLYTPLGGGTATNSGYQVVGLVAVGHSLPATAVTEIKMSSHTFMFRAGLDFTFLSLDSSVFPLTGYEPQHLMDKSLYKFIHPEDCLKLKQSHTTFLAKGQVITRYYRFLTHSGGWIWIQSFCTMIHCNRASRQHCILALNYVLSEHQYGAMLQAEEQMQELKSVNYNQTGNGNSAKRYRLSQAAINAVSHLKMEVYATDSRLTKNNFQPSNSPVVQSENTLPNSASGHTSVLSKRDPKDFKLQTDLLKFEQVMKRIPMRIEDQSLLQPSLSTTSNVVYRKHQNAYHHFDTATPFALHSTVPTGDYRPPYYDTLMNPNIYQKPPSCSKYDVSYETSLVNSERLSEKSRFTYINNYPSEHGDTENVQNCEELPYYFELISSNSSNSTKEYEGASSILTPPQNPRDVNYIFNPARLAELETRNFDGNFRNLPSRESTIDDVCSNPYFLKSLNLENGECTQEDRSHILLNTSVTDQAFPFSTDKSPGDIRSISNGHFSALNNFRSNIEQTVAQTQDNYVMSGIKKSVELWIPSNQCHESDKVISPSNMPLSNELSGNFSPLSMYNEVTASREQISEQKYFHRHSPQNNSSGFYDYVNQYNLSSPVTPDSLCDAKSRSSSDNISDKNDPTEFKSCSSDKIFYVSL